MKIEISKRELKETVVFTLVATIALIVLGGLVYDTDFWLPTLITVVLLVILAVTKVRFTD